MNKPASLSEFLKDFSLFRAKNNAPVTRGMQERYSTS